MMRRLGSVAKNWEVGRGPAARGHHWKLSDFDFFFKKKKKSEYFKTIISFKSVSDQVVGFRAYFGQVRPLKTTRAWDNCEPPPLAAHESPKLP